MALPTPGADTTAIVTGASSGIGREIARRLAGRGHGLTLVARRQERLRALADEVTSAHGVRTEIVIADLTDAAAREGVVAAVDAAGLVPAVLVNAAGLSTVGPVHRNDPGAELAMIRTDVEAVAHLCSLVSCRAWSSAAPAPCSTWRRPPLSSRCPDRRATRPARRSCVSYSQALRGELRGTGVTVTVLCPGPVETEFAEAAGFDPDDAEAALPRFMWVAVERRGRRGGRRPGQGARRGDPRGGEPAGRPRGPARAPLPAGADHRTPAPRAARLTPLRVTFMSRNAAIAS